MTAPWTVHLTPDAELVLRDASHREAADVARALDLLAQRGPATVGTDRADGHWTARIPTGALELMVAGRDDDTRIVVVRIESSEVPRAQRAVDTIPVALATRRRLGTLLHGLDLDARYTWRALRRAPVFTAVVIGTLAAGFGGATALLDIVHTVYGSALPFADGDRLVRIRNVNTSPSGDMRRYNITPADFEVLRTDNRTFTGVVAQGGRSLALLGDNDAERVSAIGVSSGWTTTLGVRPFLGRAFAPEEERLGESATVALISHSLWQRRFGGDSAALGQLLRFDGGAYTVIGVLPPHFNYPYDAAVWTPWTFAPSNATVSSLNVVARLADTVSLALARSDASRMHETRASAVATSATGFSIETVRSNLIDNEDSTVQALSAAVLCLLVLACVNVANLLVARFTTRRAELGLRAALGGRRDQQVRQMLMEALVLFAAGTAGGVLVANAVRPLLGITVPDTFRTQLGFVETHVGVPVAALALGIGLACGALVGLVAALRAVRTDPMTLVRLGGRGATSRSDRRVFDVLVAAQLGFSLVLLVGASLLIGRFRDLSTAHPGYDLAGVSTMRITIEQERYGTAEARYRLAQSIEEGLAALPGVSGAGITTVNPLCCGDWGAPIEIEGRPVLTGEPATLVAHSYVTPGYFDAMRIPVLRGEGFDARDRPSSPLTVVVDEAFAQMAWPDADPIGKRVRVAREGRPWHTVIGIVPVTEHEAEMRASWYLPYYQDPTGASTEHLHMMIRHAETLSMDALRRVVASIDPALAVYGATTMNALQRERTSQDRLGAVVSAAFAVFGLLLAGFSLYGLLSYSVELRRSEFGLRMALGARRGAIMGLVIRQAAVRLALGITVGFALALAANQVLRSAIDGLGWIAWPTALALTGLLVLVTGVATAAPAARATRVDPIRALRG